MKPSKLLLIMFIVSSISIIASTYLIGKENEERDEKESFVGKTIILGKDTLIITDYNSSNLTYNLSNRVIIDAHYVLNHAK